jgi:UDP-N-acetylglucosamine 1-carboxyvinyltransferase
MNFKNSYVKVNQSKAIGGTVAVDGAKNSILPIGPATLLSNEISRIENIPLSQDVLSMLDIIVEYGGEYYFSKNKKTIEIDTRNVKNKKVDPSFFKKYRASTLFAGATLGKFKEAWISSPGGDKIGKRPIDIHLNGFKAMGAEIFQEENHIYICAKRLHGAKIFLDYASVGATQNFLLAAASIPEKTILYNVAQEPEIDDLVQALRSMGIQINCNFPSTIEINGNEHPKAMNHFIMTDRLEAATIILAAAITKGSVHILNAPIYAMQSLISKLTQMGHEIKTNNSNIGVTFISCDDPIPVSIKTMPYPGFSTDLQSPMMALLATTIGESSIHETVFESRMSHALELNKMGADIKIEYDYAKIKGVQKLYGKNVKANDIRAFASLILAGLVAEDSETRIFGIEHLLRGYEGLDKKLRFLGADIDIIFSDLLEEENFTKYESHKSNETMQAISS